MVGLPVVLCLPQFEKLWLSRYSKVVYFHSFYLVLKFSLPVGIAGQQGHVHYESENSTKLRWKSLNLDIAICSLYFHFGVWWNINFYTSCDDTMFKALYNWFYSDKMFTHLRKSFLFGYCGRLILPPNFTYLVKKYTYWIFWDVLHNIFFFLCNMLCVL